MQPREWLDTITADGLNEVARVAGIPQRTLYNQLDKRSLSAENVVKIAAAYRVHPLRALIDCGLVDAAWEQVPDVEAALRLATDEQLTDEVLRRLKAGSPSFDTPIDELIDDSEYDWAARDAGGRGQLRALREDQDRDAEHPDE